MALRGAGCAATCARESGSVSEAEGPKPLRPPLAPRRPETPFPPPPHLISMMCDASRKMFARTSRYRASHEPRPNHGPRHAPSWPYAVGGPAPSTARAHALRSDFGQRGDGSGSTPPTRGRCEVAPVVVIRPDCGAVGVKYGEAERTRAAGEGGGDGFAPLRARGTKRRAECAQRAPGDGE